ncbi:MAG: 4-alpha-glucanotransferase [Anaerolineales bacterium]|nr:4-alpha-glucanotransferase [Anaerolineales bacterium]
MKFERASGILLHPTSLAGPYGIGDIGPQAYRWISFLADSGCGLWQILPLGPTGYGDSPYQCFSAFAGNPILVSPEALLSEDLLHSDDLVNLPDFPTDHVDFGSTISWKLGLLDRAYIRFEHLASDHLLKAFTEFQEAQTTWLGDFALFMALKESHGGAPWSTWEAPLRDRNPDALAEARHIHQVAIKRQIFRQFLFYRQWTKLRNYASKQGIKIIGDIPIFVAHDSADVWANPELYYLDETGKPTVVAGVPPDYFSPTGQLWGNPLYRWDVHANQNYAWWLDRFTSVLNQVDIVRLDHFRGFAGYWEIPGDALTAEIGRWVAGPGKDIFNTIRQSYGDLPIIAEDLGVITQDVNKLRDGLDLPGMRILQFGFEGGPEDLFLPHNYPVNCVVYTGTHDNDTAQGWYERVSDEIRNFCRRYLARDGSDISWDLIRACWSSVAVIAIAPMQDFLSLGNDARMNYPGNPSGNWSWRMHPDSLGEELSRRIKELNHLYSRSLSAIDNIIEE